MPSRWTPAVLGVRLAKHHGQPSTISLLDAKSDATLLIDRDDCNHVRVWHAAGATTLSEDQVADIFISALPGGGKRITIGDYHIKAFVTRLGVIATLWNAAAKK